MKQHQNLSEFADDGGKRRFSRKRPDTAVALAPRKPRARPRLAVTVREGLDLQAAELIDDGLWAIEPQAPAPVADTEPPLEIDFTQPWVLSNAVTDVHVAPAPDEPSGVWEIVDEIIDMAPVDDAAPEVAETEVPPIPEPQIDPQWADTDATAAQIADIPTAPTKRRSTSARPAVAASKADRPARAVKRAETRTAPSADEAAAPTPIAIPTEPTEAELAVQRAQHETMRAEAARAEAAAAKAEAERLKAQAKAARQHAQHAQLAKAEADAARAEADRLRAEAEAAKAEVERVKAASAQAERAKEQKARAEAKRLRDAAAAARVQAEQAGSALEEVAAIKAEAARLKAEAEAARAQAQEAKLAAAEMVRAAQAEAQNARAMAKEEAKAAARAARLEATRAKAAAEEERAAAIRAKAEADAVKAEADAALAAAEEVVSRAAAASVEREVIIEREVFVERPRRRRGRASSRPRLGAGPVELSTFEHASFEPVAATPADGDEPEWPRIGEHQDEDTLQPAAVGTDESCPGPWSDPRNKATYSTGRLPKVEPRPSGPFKPYQASFTTATADAAS